MLALEDLDIKKIRLAKSFYNGDDLNEILAYSGLDLNIYQVDKIAAEVYSCYDQVHKTTRSLGAPRYMDIIRFCNLLLEDVEE